jgi:putative transposase
VRPGTIRVLLPCRMEVSGRPTVVIVVFRTVVSSQALQRFCNGKVGLSYIPPGTPWNNGYIESFNNRLRKGCL